jgi:hypothetical protein
MVIYFGGCLASVLLMWLLAKSSWRPAVAGFCFASCVVGSIVQNGAIVSRGYSPLHPNADSDIREVALFVRDRAEHYGPGAVVHAPKDIGYYIGKPIHVIPTDETEMFDLLDQTESLALLADVTKGIRIYVDSTAYPVIGKDSARRFVERQFTTRTVVGTWVVYER